MIAGTLAVVIALLLKLKSTSFSSDQGAASIGTASIGIGAQERLASAEATPERITLMIEDKTTGAQRLVILDARTYQVISAISAEEAAQE